MPTYTDIMAKEIHAAVWSYGDVAEADLMTGRLFYIADAHKDGWRCVARAETLQTAYMELREMVATRDKEGRDEIRDMFIVRMCSDGSYVYGRGARHRD